MTDAIAHRGPDDWGVWTDEEAGIGLGQRRLAIVDLSPHGHQPMVSESGRWIMSFNGEIYNFKKLRDDLEKSMQAPVWRGQSDTEVLLACIEAWGVETTLQRAVGMYAISVWDRQRRVLSLARDRMGEKPLYYGKLGGRLLFASELKAITAVSRGDLEIDREALSEFLRFSYLPGQRCIWQGLCKLPPGHWIEIGSMVDVTISPRPYWQLGGVRQTELAASFEHADDETLINEAERRLTAAVELQMVADVPLGAFLSGGIDSSTVVALMQKNSARPVKTFTIGFDNPRFNEAPFAKEVAKHLGTDHTELYIGAKDAELLVPKLATIFDEPFADSSQIPTTLVSLLTRQHVKVALSGDGGDELFAGYERYATTAATWRMINGFPMPIRQTIARLLGALEEATWDRLIKLLPPSLNNNLNGRRINRMSRMIVARSLGEFYVRLMSQWQPEECLVLGLSPRTFQFGNWDNSMDPIESMRRWDISQYLPDDLLVKVDRASMNASLEVRAPMLDHRLVELAFAMPEHSLVRDGVGKWALRQVLYRHVPQQLIERPKTGFSIPLADWLRGPLRAWAEDTLATDNLDKTGLLDPLPIRRLWHEHLSGRADRSSYIWNILTFQTWHSSQC